MSSWRTKRGESQIPASIFHQSCCSTQRRPINLGLSRINHELSFPEYCKFVLQIPLFLSARWQQPLWGVHHYQQRCVPPSAHLVLHNFSSQGPIFRLCYSFISDICTCDAYLLFWGSNFVLTVPVFFAFVAVGTLSVTRMFCLLLMCCCCCFCCCHCHPVRKMMATLVSAVAHSCHGRRVPP